MIGLLLGTALVAAPAQLPSASAVVDAARTAQFPGGGDAMIEAIHAVAACEGPRGAYTTRVYSVRDGRATFAQDFPTRPPFRAGTMPVPWETAGDTLTRRPEPALRAFINGHELHMLALDARTRFEVVDENVARAPFEGVDAYRVRMRDALGARVDFFYHPTTRLPLGYTATSDPAGGEPDVRLVMESWTEQAGRRVLERATFYAGGEAFRFRYTDVRFEQNVDATALAPDSTAGTLLGPGQVSALVQSVSGVPHEGVGLVPLLSIDHDPRTGALTVIAPVPGTPAARALQPGDAIVEIDGVDAATMALSVAAARINVARGATVRLTVERAGARRVLTLRGDSIRIPEATLERDGDIATLRIVQFTPGIAAHAQALAASAVADGVRGLILDLRGNPGGMLDEAQRLAGTFLGDAVVAYAQSADGRQELRTMRTGLTIDVPVVVIVDRGSASAAEVLASALHAAGRAHTIGERTVGKGLIHVPSAAADGQTLLGIGGWLITPDGRNILEDAFVPAQIVEGGAAQTSAAAAWLRQQLAQ